MGYTWKCKMLTKRQGNFKMSRSKTLTASLIACLIAALVPFLSGCNDPKQQQQLDEVVRGLQDAIGRAAESMDGIAPAAKDVSQMTGEELSKLYSWEYVVKEFNWDTPTEKMNEELVALGRDRWECFATVNEASKTRIFCKRRPETYLKYLSHVVPGLGQ